MREAIEKLGSRLVSESEGCGQLMQLTMLTTNRIVKVEIHVGFCDHQRQQATGGGYWTK